MRKTSRTVSSILDLIDASEDFVYGMSSAQQYAWVKERHPDLWQRVKDAVAAGRFVPLGGMWVESDTVMPSGESLVRQFLYGQRFFEQEFGSRARGVWLPDSFGYSPALPQLMELAGFEWFFTQKMSWNQTNVFPHHTFLWRGIDGTPMLTHFTAHGHLQRTAQRRGAREGLGQLQGEPHRRRVDRTDRIRRRRRRHDARDARAGEPLRRPRGQRARRVGEPRRVLRQPGRCA